MDLLEHQGKELFERHGIKLIPRAVAASAAEAREAAGRLGPVAVKVQVQAGGRGKGGGIVLAKTPEEAERAARKMFEGGIDIEEVAATRPEAIRRAAIDPLLGLKPFHVRRLVGGFPEDARDGAGALLERIYEVLITNEAKLDGQVGIIGNGAGLVMSTLDVVQQAGGAAANFLDVGGGAGADVMAASLEVILSDPAVRSVLVNIFGGITRGDLVARGILEALERVEATVPIVVRLDGTNAEEGRGLRADAGPPRIVPPAPMLEAARLAVEAAA